MRYLAALFFVFCAAYELHAQMPIPQDPHISDTALVHSLIDSSFEYSFSDPDTAIKFAKRAKRLSESLNYSKGIAEAHGELGYSFNRKGEFDRAIDHFDKGIRLLRALRDTMGLIAQLNDLGSTYSSMSEYNTALEHYFESLELCEAIGLERGISSNLGNIGLAYFELDRDEKAMEFYKRALEINQRLENKNSLATNYNNLGLLHGDQGRYEEALDFHFKALVIRQELGYTLSIANSLNNIGRVYMQKGEHDKAMKYLNRALQVNDGKDKDLSSIIHENMTKTYISMGKLDSARVHGEQTLDLSREYGSKLGVKVGYELLTDIYLKLGNYKRAFENQRKLMVVKDSILNAEKSKQISELQTKYETRQKEQEIALLEQEKEQEAMLRNAFLAGLVLIGIIGFLIYNRQRLKIKKNRTELENKRLHEEQLEKDLEFKNRQLTTHSLHLVQKNEAMRELKQEIELLKEESAGEVSRDLQKLQNKVDYSFNLDEDWEEFKLYFEEVHTGFFEALKEQYPDLTSNELRLSALAKLNLSIKETATILGIRPDSVKTARYRLRKKLGMETEEKLTDFMMAVEKEQVG
ncbi:tetratricopeptide repeat protein [Balneolaceae bacterium YR4-1]|uniref:Tetratricopeptide repeat protein n=1 Tax=Halalkalibaculum roseum TaxID=2709311 RepID=A0A6M1SSV1_9BACT|nr:tetratricopeptide repeat protein [Halalkalibaculum roseum]NGP75852.1 tetratricopeptide repeat protein [Halalkalibaculum roseum]